MDYTNYDYTKEADILGLTVQQVKSIVDSITLIGKLAYSNAVDKGFYNFDSMPTFGDRISLIHSEVSEALEEFRNNHKPDELYFSDGGKLEGCGAEIADCMIRCCDMSTHENMPIGHAIVVKMAYNKSRPYKHGGKKL